MLGHRVNNRREDMQHENHGCNQAWPEKNGDGTGSTFAQKPGAEGRPGGGVWRELSGCVAWQRQGRPEAALACLVRGSSMTALRPWEETQPLETSCDGTQTDAQPTNVQFLFLSFSNCHACCQTDTSAMKDCLDCYVLGWMEAGFCHSHSRWRLVAKIYLPKKILQNSWKKCIAKWNLDSYRSDLIQWPVWNSL